MLPTWTITLNKFLIGNRWNIQSRKLICANKALRTRINPDISYFSLPTPKFLARAYNALYL